MAYGLNDLGLNPGRARDLSFTTVSTGAHPAPYPMDTGIELPGHEAVHSPPTCAEVK
jgi:hypothetical protein